MPLLPCTRPPTQPEAHAHDAYDFSDDEAAPPFREQLSKAAKRSHAEAAAGGGVAVVGAKPAKRSKR